MENPTFSPTDCDSAWEQLLPFVQKVAKDAKPEYLALAKNAFKGIFTANGKRLRANAESWCGYVLRDGTIDTKKREQCLRSAFCRLFHYHNGRDNGYLGTIINATGNLESMAEAYGICPHPESSTKWYQFPSGSIEYVEAQKRRDENRVIGKEFADLCDTVIQVLLYVSTGGKTSSRAGDIWRKAMMGS